MLVGYGAKIVKKTIAKNGVGARKVRRGWFGLKSRRERILQSVG